MSGGLEMLWQLSNYNFSKWAEGLVQDIGGIKNQRWWRFTYDPSLEKHGFVRVTYKERLTDVATSSPTEWKPWVDTPAGSLLERDTSRHASRATRLDNGQWSTPVVKATADF
eukprot:scaffold12001_cov116-Isochrysis_galbana.AAC.5